jgi:hypothetical protein
VKKVPLERKRWREAYPAEFNDGVRIGFFGEAKTERDPTGGGYPHGFHQWSIDRRNAWFCGFNRGYIKRKQAEQEVADRQEGEPTRSTRSSRNRVPFNQPISA